MVRLLRIAAWLIVLTPCGVALGQDTELLVRGKYLVDGVVACGNCHIARNDKGQPDFKRGLSGGMVFDDPAFKAYGANITPDDETGIGKWTDAQLAYAIREGIRPDGTLIGPPMPISFYRNMSDADLAAIIAYLRSQPAIRNHVKKSVYNVPLPSNYGAPVQRVNTPSSSDKIVYGQYLANIGHCLECHTPRNDKGILIESEKGAGGQVFKGPWGESVSRNLTSHESGLKDWSDKQIALAIQQGVDRQNIHYKPPMAFDWYKNISEADIAALIAYLRSLPPQPFGGK